MDKTCQPNNCVTVLQRLRGGWQMRKMQTLKPLKRNCNRFQLSSSISGAWDHRKSISEWLQCNFDYCNRLFIVLTLMDAGGMFNVNPTPKEGQGGSLSHQGTDTEHCPKAPRRPSSDSTSLAPRKPGAGESSPPRAPGGCHCMFEGA